MPSDNVQHITIEVADNSFSLYVRPEQEELIRLASKDVNERIAVYRSKNQKADILQILSFIAVEYASNVRRLQMDKDETPVVAQMERVNDMLDDILNEEF
ncbi:MAG: cell division protein ZapA [Bacteroidales bacterium]|nr:cell division protein ZapA [Bacteroidales bacterium]